MQECVYLDCRFVIVCIHTTSSCCVLGISKVYCVRAEGAHLQGQGLVISASEAAELRAAAAEKTALLGAAEERLARLEALHRIAQVSYFWLPSLVGPYRLRTM